MHSQLVKANKLYCCKYCTNVKTCIQLNLMNKHIQNPIPTLTKLNSNLYRRIWPVFTKKTTRYNTSSNTSRMHNINEADIIEANQISSLYDVCRPLLFLFMYIQENLYKPLHSFLIIQNIVLFFR